MTTTSSVNMVAIRGSALSRISGVQLSQDAIDAGQQKLHRIDPYAPTIDEHFDAWYEQIADQLKAWEDHTLAACKFFFARARPPRDVVAESDGASA